MGWGFFVSPLSTRPHAPICPHAATCVHSATSVHVARCSRWQPTLRDVGSQDWVIGRTELHNGRPNWAETWSAIYARYGSPQARVWMPDVGGNWTATYPRYGSPHGQVWPSDVAGSGCPSGRVVAVHVDRFWPAKWTYSGRPSGRILAVHLCAKGRPHDIACGRPF